MGILVVDMHHQVARIAAAALLLAGGIWAQTASAPPAFEVASIKPAPPPDPAKFMAGKMHIGVTIDGARVDMGGLSLTALLCFAYSVKPFQVAGPDWLGTARFDVLAKLPEGASKDQVPVMLQGLLAERFKLTLRQEKKDQAVYALVVGKNGPKLKESPPDADAPSGDTGAPLPMPLPPPPPGFGPGPGQMRMNRDGNGMSVAGGPMGNMRMSMGQEGTMHFELSKATMTMLADMLSQFVDRPVVDMTELKGNYQVALDLSPEDMRNAFRVVSQMAGAAGMPPPPPGGEFGRGLTAPASGSASDSAPAAIFASVQRLGLKLEPRKTPMPSLVVEHAEKMPTEN